MCYAHPNGDRGSRYHYHVWSPCLSTCTGESELIGIALDGFPIYGPGINPDTGKVWSQSDMDLCGGRQDKNGKYAYYTTVDFPYMLQCYRGHTDQTENLVNGKSFKTWIGFWLVNWLFFQPLIFEFLTKAGSNQCRIVDFTMKIVLIQTWKSLTKISLIQLNNGLTELSKFILKSIR